MKNSLLAKTMLIESSETYEDSSSISLKLSNKLKSKITKIKSFVVDFKQNIRELLPTGRTVNPNDILFLIEDEISEGFSNFSTTNLEVLKRISNKAPKAKMKGKIDRYEVYYHGELDDMSETLRELTIKSDKQFTIENKSINKKSVTGRVDEGYNVEGKALLYGTAEIKVYLTKEETANSGDKGVFGNQMKSVFGEVMDYDIYSFNGEIIDAKFSYISLAKRIVNSSIIIGTTNTILKLASKRVVEIYESK